jgi:small subunit ribosomal protein S17
LKKTERSIKMGKDIGLGIKEPKETCEDDNCPFHGSLRVRGRQFTGVVISSKMHSTATVEWIRTIHIPKYERYEKKRSKIKAHNPKCINALEGDLVRVIECRPLSKTKNFVIIEKIGRERLFTERMEAEDEAKAKKEKEEKKTEEKEEEESKK